MPQRLKDIRLIGSVGGPSGWYISPHGYNLYRTAAGDSFASLARTYLNDSNRAAEIYGLQSPGWLSDHGDDINNLPAGEELVMPQAAIDAAKAQGLASGGKGEPPTAVFNQKTEVNGTDVFKPSTPSTPRPLTVVPKNTPVTPVPPPPPPLAAHVGKGVIIGGAVALVGVLGFVAYKVAKKPARRTNPGKRRAARKGFAKQWNAAEG